MAITGYFIDDDWQYREVLLGFKPAPGSHTGENLCAILLNVLQEHQIQDRILAITADNASNNDTLFTALQQSVSDSVTLIRVPCLAHVIQLSLNKLLDRMNAAPKNETTEQRWTNERSQKARANATASLKKHRITYTLHKV